MSLDDDSIRTVRTAAKLMNLGRANVPKELLTLRRNLGPAEIERVREGIRSSARMVAEVNFDGAVAETIAQVHEHADGTGKPKGLNGDDILLSARIVAVSDAFASMTSPRVHRAALAIDAAERQLSALSGVRFDRKVVAALLNYLENHGGRYDWAHFSSPTPLAAE